MMIKIRETSTKKLSLYFLNNQFTRKFRKSKFNLTQVPNLLRCKKKMTIEMLQLRAKFQAATVSCSRFVWITNSSDHSDTANLLLTKSLQEIRSSNPPVVTGICDPNKSRARHHRKVTIFLAVHVKYLS